jgi:hypothetical protein
VSAFVLSWNVKYFGFQLCLEKKKQMSGLCGREQADIAKLV